MILAIIIARLGGLQMSLAARLALALTLAWLALAWATDNREAMARCQAAGFSFATCHHNLNR